MATEQRTKPGLTSTTLWAVVIVVAVLYFAREVFIPFALALLLSFLLAPLVVRLRRWHFGRVPSVLCVVLLSFVVVTTIGSVVAGQLSDLAHKMPLYQQNIHNKIRSIGASSSGLINRLSNAVEQFGRELNPSESNPGEERPVPVEIRKNPLSPLDVIQTVLGSILNVLLVAAIVVVFVIFMLFQREDLRDRFIRLVGAGRLNVTTKALDDAARRVSRFLAAQLVVNTAYGIVVGTGLFFLGLPNPILWAVLAGLLRYVPYLGIWIASFMPAAVALAVSPGWLEPLAIIGLYFGVDLLIYNFVEPLWYGSSTGISPMAILAAAVFWTWLWGPIGLLLSTPLTVCLVVVGQYVPSLEFLSVLLSDQPVLSTDKRLYQRLLSSDIESAYRLLNECSKKRELAELFETMLLPALAMMDEDRRQGRLSADRRNALLRNTRRLLDRFIRRVSRRESRSGKASPAGRNRGTGKAAADAVSVLVVPGRDEADEIGAVMLVELLRHQGIEGKVCSGAAVSSLKLSQSDGNGIRVVTVTAVFHLESEMLEHLCEQLRQQFPGVRIVAAILQSGIYAHGGLHELLPGPDANAWSLRDAVSEIMSSMPRLPDEPNVTAQIEDDAVRN